jgi:trehalose 6-phosphate phosphatase
LVEAFCRGLAPTELLVASDFDGTLSPIVARPEAARPLPTAVTAIERLVALGAQVAVISGRSLEVLRRVLPMRGVTLLGDYGLEAPDEREKEALAAFNARAEEAFTGVEGVVVEPKPGSTSVHYRDNPAAGEAVYERLVPLARGLGLRATEGRMVVEVRPAAADKGLALQRLLDRLRPRALVFAGDDEGDRTAFAAATGLRHLVVGVGSGEVAADLFEDCDAVVAGPAEWALLLAAIADHF